MNNPRMVLVAACAGLASAFVGVADAAGIPSGPAPQASAVYTVSGAVGTAVWGLPGFAGVWVDESGMILVAMQQGHQGEVADAMGNSFQGQYVVQGVVKSYADLVAGRDAISALVAALKLRGLELTQWGPDEVHNTVQVSIRGYTREKAALAREILGDDVIVTADTTEGGIKDLFSALAYSTAQPPPPAEP